MMTLDKFIKTLELHKKGKENWSVVIPISGESGIGGASVIEIKQIGIGFDWDHGKIFLYPEKPLYKKSQNKKGLK